MTKRTVSVIIGVVPSWGISLEDLEDIIKQAKIRIRQENLQAPRLDLGYTKGYYDDIEVTAKFIATRFETDEEKQLREQEEQYDKQRWAKNLSQQVRELSKAEKRKIFEELEKQFKKD
jgi:hypothetical protein